MSTFCYTGSQLSFLGFVTLPMFLFGMTSRALCDQSKAAPFRIYEPSKLHANQAEFWNQFTWACCQRKMFMCVRVLKDWIERPEARLSRMGLGRIPHVLRGQAEDKRRYSREAKNRSAFFTVWLASPATVPFFKQNLLWPQNLYWSCQLYWFTQNLPDFDQLPKCKHFKRCPKEACLKNSWCKVLKQSINNPM